MNKKSKSSEDFDPSCTKVFGTHTFYWEGGGGGRGTKISKTVNFTNFNFNSYFYAKYLHFGIADT